MTDASNAPGPSRPDEAAHHVLALSGTGPLGEGSHLRITVGETVVVGRSRHCDWSLKRTPAWLRKPELERQRIRKTLPWRATSRRHCRIAYVAPDLVDVQNLSANGTLVDGHRIDRIVLTDCRERTHSVRLGPEGVILQLRVTATNGH